MTTPDKEDMPTDMTAGRLLTPLAVRKHPTSLALYIVDANETVLAEMQRLRDADNEVRVADSIVTACNGYEPIREALTELLNVPELADIDPEDRSEECWEAERKARAALSTLPVNDRHHSGSDNERMFENRAALSTDEVTS